MDKPLPRLWQLGQGVSGWNFYRMSLVPYCGFFVHLNSSESYAMWIPSCFQIGLWRRGHPEVCCLMSVKTPSGIDCRFRFWYWSVLQRTDCRDSTYGAIILWFDACFLTLSTESSWGIYINQSWRTAIMPSSLAAGSARRGTQQSWSGNKCVIPTFPSQSRTWDDSFPHWVSTLPTVKAKLWAGQGQVGEESHTCHTLALAWLEFGTNHPEAFS